MIILGNCLDKLKELEDNSIDSIVTDPPYEIGFMGKGWDNTGIANNVEMWRECLRVLKPGGHLLSFAATRTYHRMTCAIEDAGFEVRDMIEWVYGSGFPKSLNISKQLEKQGYIEEAKEWNGRGTSIKPAHEPICMARKPLAEKTVAENVLKYGTGGINIDDSRVDLIGIEEHSTEGKSGLGNNVFGKYENKPKELTDLPRYNLQGRFPANLILEDCEEVRECFPETKTNSTGEKGIGWTNLMQGCDMPRNVSYGSNSGNASRFFKSILYYPKSSKAERNKGCKDLPLGEPPASARSKPAEGRENALGNPRANNHPTVKPIALMEYLIKMVTPKGGIVLDPFAGSGSTLVAAKQNGYQYIGIEMTEEYIPIIEARLNAVESK